MTCRFMSVVLAIAAMLATAAASAQEPDELKTDAATAQAPERDDDTADVGIIAKARRWAEEKQIVDRLSPPEWAYPPLAGMTTGSGLALGAGYLNYLFDERIFTDVSAALSTKIYKAIDARARWAQFWNNRVEIWSDFRYRDYPQEDYFGP